jgi:hypothetical protein
MGKRHVPGLFAVIAAFPVFACSADFVTLIC